MNLYIFCLNLNYVIRRQSSTNDRDVFGTLNTYIKKIWENLYVITSELDLNLKSGDTYVVFNINFALFITI